jgi:hypothetical protein
MLVHFLIGCRKPCSRVSRVQCLNICGAAQRDLSQFVLQLIGAETQQVRCQILNMRYETGLLLESETAWKLIQSFLHTYVNFICGSRTRRFNMLVPKPATGHDPKPVPLTSSPITHLPTIYLTVALSSPRFSKLTFSKKFRNQNSVCVPGTPISSHLPNSS